MYPYVIRMPLECTNMSSVCNSYVLACHSYVTCMYSYVIYMSLVCTRMLSVCHSSVLVSHWYVTCMYSYVIRISLVCGFTMNPKILINMMLKPHKNIYIADWYLKSNWLNFKNLFGKVTEFVQIIYFLWHIIYCSHNTEKKLDENKRSCAPWKLISSSRYILTGAIEFTLIPLGAHSKASVFVKFIIPARAAAVWLKEK